MTRYFSAGLVVVWTAALTACSTTHHAPPPQIPAEVERVVRNAPFVMVMNTNGLFGSTSMAIVRDGGKHLLLSPHQLLGATSGTFDLVLPNQVWLGRTEFRVVSEIGGPHPISGWALLEIDPPIEHEFIDVPEDFTTPIPVGDPVYTVFWSQCDPEIVKKRPLGCGYSVRSGRVIEKLPEHHLDEGMPINEFLWARAAWPPGSSGAPVFWCPSEGGDPVIIGSVVGGVT